MIESTEDIQWIYSWWAMLPPEYWLDLRRALRREYDRADLRPTEQSALENIAYESYIAKSWRSGDGE